MPINIYSVSCVNVDGVGVTVSAVSSVVRQLQTGNIGFYIFSMVLGVIAIIFWNVLK